MKAAVDEARNAKIAALMLPGLGVKDDISAAHDLGVSVIRIATHCTEADISEQHFAMSRELGLETVGFLMMAHTVRPEVLATQARIMADAGCQCVYVVDSAGAMILDDVTERVAAVVAELGDDAQVGIPRPREPRRCRSPTRSWRSGPAPCRSTAPPVGSEPARATPAARRSPQ